MDKPTDGYIYGQPPPPVDKHVPDVKGMLEATGIPEEGEGEGGLPFSLEWYAGAKDRQIARDKEIDELLYRKNDLRTDWAVMVCRELAEVMERVTSIRAEPEPLEIAKVFARTVHERPYDTAEADILRQLDSASKIERDRLREELTAVHDRIEVLDSGIKQREEIALASEMERRKEVAAQRKYKAKSERALKRNAARLAGEEVMDTDEEEAMIEAEEAAAAAAEGGSVSSRSNAGSERKSASKPTSAGQKHTGGGSSARPQSGSSAGGGVRSRTPESSASPAGPLNLAPPRLAPAPTGVPPLPASVTLPTPAPGSRGGMATQLPPLRSPPPAPPSR